MPQSHSVRSDYAVFGNPVEQSLSPRIQTLFGGEVGLPMDYQKQRVDEGNFAQAADDFFNRGGQGLNITVPFKQDAYRYAAKLTPRARKAGAVNVLALQQGGFVLGDNTDGIGLYRDITEGQSWEIKARKLLILGAGGAVRGVLEPLLAAKPESIVIANRTPEKAHQLAQGFSDLGVIKGCGFGDLSGHSFDIIINGTSASLAGESLPIAPEVIHAGSRCYDMMYGAEPTVFLQWATQKGCGHCVDGLGMLVEQAAESFYIWRGVRPSVAPVVKQLRAELAV